MLNDAPNLNYLWASLMVEEFIRSGVDTFVVSPGSRSSPLAMAVATGGPLRSFVHFDERGAAYYALGHAKSTGRPVVFICTSGTALANAMPAVVEASQAQVPLIVVSADRPPELIDTGANQAIDQVKFFGDQVRWYHSLPCPDMQVPPAVVLTAVDQAVHRAMAAPAGPVHLNCPYREPLAPAAVPFDAQTYTRPLASWFDGPYTAWSPGETSVADKDVPGLVSLLGQTRHGLLIVGQLTSRADVLAARALAKALHWPVLPDVASGLRLGPQEFPGLAYFPQLLRSRHEYDFSTAQVLVHVGGAVTSKALLQFIEATPSRNYVRVSPHPFRHDPAHRISHRLMMGIAAFARLVESAPGLGVDEDWAASLAESSRKIDACIDGFLDRTPALSEVSVARDVTRLAPEGSVLFLGNSMPIRDADMFGATDGNDIIATANRGASGIDGTLATAAGFAAGLRRRTTALLGDLSVLHDLNSLALVDSLNVPFTLVTVNNDGGGIFSFLPIADHPKHFERFFGTPHGMNFERIAPAFGLEYVHADSRDGFKEAYARASAENGHCLIEVNTRRDDNERLHRAIDKEILAALAVET